MKSENKLTNIEIIDNYTGIPFRKIKYLFELRVGMQIQIVERNTIPLRWSWMVVDEAFLIKMAEMSSRVPKAGHFVFKDKIPSEVIGWVEPENNYNIFDWIRVIDVV